MLLPSYQAIRIQLVILVSMKAINVTHEGFCKYVRPYFSAGI